MGEHTTLSYTRKLDAAVLILGFSGLMAQVLLMRELMVAYTGNELTLGLIVAQWLAGEGIGCLTAGRRLEHSPRPHVHFIGGTFLFCIVLPLALFSARLLRLGSGSPLGELLPPTWVFISSFLLVAPPAFLHGALFPLACRIAHSFGPDPARAVGRVYVFETVGTLLGALAGMLFLFPALNAFSFAMALALLNGLASLALASAYPIHTVPRTPLLGVWLLAVLLTAVPLLMLMTRADHLLHRISLEQQWRGFRLLHTRQSRYALWNVLENQHQYLFVANNQVIAMAPIPNRYEIEVLAHLPLLFHPNPRRVLVAGGGPGGLLQELLTHPSVQRVDAAEMDPVLLDLFAAFPTPVTLAEFTDPRVRLIPTDPRRFLRRSPDAYDVILIGFSDPSTLQANRLLTQEFLHLARSRLNPGGILALGIPGGLSYLPEETQEIQNTLWHTAGTAFRYVRVLPGEGRTLFLASESNLSNLAPESILARASQRNLFDGIPVPWHVEQRLHPAWDEWFLQIVSTRPPRINRDFRPIAVYYALGRWLAVHTPSAARLWRGLARCQPNHPLIMLLAGVFGLLLLGWIFHRRSGPPNMFALPFAIGSTGSCAMGMDLALLMTLQTTFGCVYGWMAGFVAAFMGGAALSAEWIRHRLPNSLIATTWLIRLDGMIAGLAFLFPLLLQILSRLGCRVEPPALLLLLALSFICGALTGAQFPTATKLWQQRRSSAQPHSIAPLFTSDLTGGWIAALLVPTLCLPLLGMGPTFWALGTFKAASFFFLKKNMPPAGAVE